MSVIAWNTQFTHRRHIIAPPHTPPLTCAQMRCNAFPQKDSFGNLQLVIARRRSLLARDFYIKLEMNPGTNIPPTIEHAEEVAHLLQQALALLELTPLRTGLSVQQLRPTDRLVRLPEVERLTGLRKSAIYDQMQKGTFPKSVKCGARAAMWSELAIQSWITARLAHQPN